MVLRLLPLVAMTLFARRPWAAPLRSSKFAALMLSPMNRRLTRKTMVFRADVRQLPLREVAGRDFCCRAVASSQTEEGRAQFHHRAE